MTSAERIAIVHDYLNQRGGAERVVAAIHGIFPDAPIFTSLLDRDQLWPELADAAIRPSWMQRLPGRRRLFKAYLPLYPMVFDGLDLQGFDLVLSSSSSFAKGVRRPSTAVHVCYCHGPTRFLWDQARYLEGAGLSGPKRHLLRPILSRLQRWDLRAALRPDAILANSRWAADRIESVYGRKAEVVYPPVSVDRFSPSRVRGDYYLVIARLAGYKRADLAVRTCLRLGRHLIVAGDGPARRELERLGRGQAFFIGRPSEEALPGLYAGARALLVGAEEDFGITMVEAHASGLPVVAFARGGAAEIVEEGVSGVLFHAQEVEAMEAAIRLVEKIPWDPDRIKRSADRFALSAFRTRYVEAVEQAIERSRRVPAA